MKNIKSQEKKEIKKYIELSLDDERMHYDIYKFIEQLYHSKPLKNH